MATKKDLYGKSSGVIELKRTDFKKGKIINAEFKGKSGLIIYYAPWCIHCKNISEMWSDLAIQFKNIYTFAAVNCEKVECRDISGYPTIKYVNNKGDIVRYQGNNTRDDIIYFITSIN